MSKVGCLLTVCSTQSESESERRRERREKLLFHARARLVVTREKKQLEREKKQLEREKKQLEGRGVEVGRRHTILDGQNL